MPEAAVDENGENGSRMPVGSSTPPPITTTLARRTMRPTGSSKSRSPWRSAGRRCPRKISGPAAAVKWLSVHLGISLPREFLQDATGQRGADKINTFIPGDRKSVV